MEIISDRYPGIMLICEGCGAVLGHINKADIYAENLVYCPICKFQNKLNFNKNYDGIITEEKKNVVQS